jgi:hypothetical protein
MLRFCTNSSLRVNRKDPADGLKTSEDNPVPWPQASSRKKHMNADNLQDIRQAAALYISLAMSTPQQLDHRASDSTFMNVPTHTHTQQHVAFLISISNCSKSHHIRPPQPPPSPKYVSIRLHNLMVKSNCS